MPENFESQQEKSSENNEKENLKFRNLRLEDCDRMLEIRNRVVLEEKVPFGSRKELKKEEFLPKFQESLEAANRKEAIDVAAEVDGNLVGWIAGHNVPNAEVPTASIDVLIIDKKARKHIKGRALVERWEDRAAQEWKSEKIITATQAENLKARKSWESYGFKKTEFFKGQDGFDYVRMEKNLE